MWHQPSPFIHQHGLYPAPPPFHAAVSYPVQGSGMYNPHQVTVQPWASGRPGVAVPTHSRRRKYHSNQVEVEYMASGRVHFTIQVDIASCTNIDDFTARVKHRLAHHPNLPHPSLSDTDGVLQYCDSPGEWLTITSATRVSTDIATCIRVRWTQAIKPRDTTHTTHHNQDSPPDPARMKALNTTAKHALVLARLNDTQRSHAHTHHFAQHALGSTQLHDVEHSRGFDSDTDDSG